MNITTIEGSSRVKGAGVDKGKLGILIQNNPRKDGSLPAPVLYMYKVGKEAGSVFQQLLDAESKGKFFGEVAANYPMVGKTVQD